MDPLPVSVSVAASTEVDEDKRDAPRDGPPREKDREARESRESIGIDDLNLPRSIVTRLAKGVLPPNTQIQGNALLALTKSATVFVSYLTAGANERAQQANRKTMTPADVFECLEELQFDQFRGRLETELQRFTELQNEKRQNRKRVVADRVAGSDAPARGQGADQDEEPGDVATGMPQAKKARRGTVSDAPRQGGDEGDADDTEVGEEERDEDDDEEDDDEEQDDDEESSEAGEDTGDQARDAGGGVSDRARSEDEALDNGDDSD